MPEDARARARIVQKQPGVVFGLAAVAEAMRQCGVEDVDNLVVEGQWREEVPGRGRCSPAGPAAGAARRRAHRAQLPRPPLRRRDADGALRRGGRRHRRRDPRHPQDDPGPARPGEGGGASPAAAATTGIGLYDAILIKENHIAIAGSLAKAVHGARTAHPDLAVEVECRNLDEVSYALGTGADLLLLDNMDADDPARSGAPARRERRPAGKGPSLEASGGVNLETVRAIAETGVDLHLDRRPDPLGPDPRLQPARRAGIDAIA